jgi:hypothetical protein
MTYFSPNTLDAIISLLVNVLYHSKGSQTLKFSDLIIAFHIDHARPTSPLFSARMGTQIQNYPA